jgi:hypothetical protein
MKFQLTTWLTAFICTFFTLCVSGSGFYLSLFQPDDRVAIVGNSFADQMRHHGYFETLVRYYHQEDELVFRNFGWAGDTLVDRARPENFPSEHESLKNFSASMILICFGMGDSLDGPDGLKDFKNNLSALCDKYSKETYDGSNSPRLLLISPTAIESSHGGFDVVDRNLVLESYVETIQSVASERSIPFVDLFHPTRSLLRESGGSRLTTNGVVLNAYGYWVVGSLMVESLMRSEYYFETAASSPDERISQPFGSEMKDFQDIGSYYRWATTRSAVNLLPPAGSQVHPSLKNKNDQLAARSLTTGIYALELNGKLVARGTDEEWASGISIEAVETHQLLEELRQQVIDKNTQFFFGWKSLNQVHIVGERKKSPSGRSIPDELVQFYELTEEKEAVLTSRFSSLKESAWELKRDLD